VIYIDELEFDEYAGTATTKLIAFVYVKKPTTWGKYIEFVEV